PRQPDHSKLGRGIIRLSETADKTGEGGCVDDRGSDRSAALGVLAPMSESMTGRRGMSFQMDGDHRVPFPFAHIGKRPVPQNSGIVHENVETPELLQSRCHELTRLIPVRHVMTADGSLATRSFDFPDHLLCRRGVLTLAVKIATLVVDDDRGSVTGE